jgi:hypothetical protein
MSAARLLRERSDRLPILISPREKFALFTIQGKLRDPNSSGLIVKSAYLLNTFIFSDGPTEPIQPSLSIHDVKRLSNARSS